MNYCTRLRTRWITRVCTWGTIAPT